MGLCAFTAEGLGSIPGLGTRIPQAERYGHKRKKKKKERIVISFKTAELTNTLGPLSEGPHENTFIHTEKIHI